MKLRSCSLKFLFEVEVAHKYRRKSSTVSWWEDGMVGGIRIKFRFPYARCVHIPLAEHPKFVCLHTQTLNALQETWKKKKYIIFTLSNETNVHR